MTVTLTRPAAAEFPSMGRPKKRHKTTSIRVYEDVGNLIHRIAGALHVDTADMLDEVLRQFVEKKREEAAKSLLAKTKDKH